MNALTVSPDMELLIPREVSESLRLKPGQRLRALEYNGVIRLIPVPTIEEARGMFDLESTDVEREPDREF